MSEITTSVSLTPDFNALPVAIYRCKADENWTMKYLSEGFRQIFGFDCKDLVENSKMCFSELIHPDDVGVTYDLLPLLALGHSFVLRFRLKTADGRYEMVEDRGTVTKCSAGGWMVDGVLIPLEYSTTTSANIDNGKSGIDYSNLFDMMPNFVCVINDKGGLEAVNDTFVKQLKYPAEALTKQSILNLVHPDDSERTKKEIVKARSGGTVFNFSNRILKADGNVLTVLWTASRSKRGRGIYAIGQDISDIQKKEQQLRESNERFVLTGERWLLKFCLGRPAAQTPSRYPTSLEFIPDNIFHHCNCSTFRLH